MKKGLAALAAAGTMAVMALGQPTQASAEQGATVINEFGCAIAGDNWSGGVPLNTAQVTHYTETPSEKAILQCLFVIPEGYEPIRAVRMTDFECVTPLGPTTDSETISTPGGTVHLRCVIH